MNTQTINLTPPIDGVQYGISTEPIKDIFKDSGDDCVFLSKYGIYLTADRVDFQALHNYTAYKIICSTNPKDTRFPYLQLVCPTCGKMEWGVCSNSWHKTVPSKEQEVEKLIYGCFGKEEWDKVHRNAKLALIETFMNNPAKYTMEDMINVAKFATGTYRTEKQIKNYIQSLQPTAKAVRVEMEEIELKYRLSAISKQFNEEDFTKELHKSLEENPNHDVKTFRHQYADKLGIPKYKIKVEASSEHSQGVIKALEVIY